MRLTALTLHGFKSFGNRTTIEFAPGITAIVGPNGSGKSNVIDALKWSSGGGRATEFRAGEKTELIFHGAAGKRSLGYAEVELELRDERRRVNIFRSLHRDGSGRLRLNGKNARFMDIDEELAGSGLGKSGLAVIGQGEVSGVLMADPAKLLQYVAEAAGVARLAGRREQTQERLETARDHLERLGDLMQELARQVERLEGEAAGAARHAELSRESLRLRYTLARLREAGLRSEIGALREERDDLQRQIEAGREEIAGLRERLAERRRAQSDAERDYREAMAATETRRGDVRVARARVEALSSRAGDLSRQQAAVERELTGLADLSAPGEPDMADENDLKRAETDAQVRLEAARRDLLEGEEALRAARHEVEELVRRETLSAQKRAALESRRQALTAELEEFGRQELEAGADGGEVAELPEREAEVDRIAQRVRSLAEELAGVRGELEDAQREHANAVAEAQARKRAAERSRQAFEARRGYAEGPRNALASGVPGVHGSVADLLRVPERFREAIAGALGRRIEYVVVDSSATGQRVLDHVRRSGGFVTVLPLDLIERRSVQLPGTISRRAGTIGLAAELVDIDERFRPVVEQLLGSTTVVESMPAALAIAREERSRPRLVTLEGDIVESYGAMSGGRRQAQAGVLGAAAELEEAESSAARAQQRAEGAERQLQSVQERARKLIAGETAARAELEEARRALAEAREAVAGRRELQAERRRRRERVEAELAGLENAGEEEDLEPRVVEARSRLVRIEEELVDCRRQVEEYQGQLAERRQERLLAVERRAAYEAALGQYRRDLQRREELERRRDALNADATRLEGERQEAASRLSEAERAVPTDLEDRQVGYEAAVREAEAADSELTRAAEANAGRGDAVERLNVTLARREAAWELAGEELRGFPPAVASVDGSERALRARLNEATAELEELGAVNHRAGLELEAERERLTELEGEAGRGRQAIEELARTLEQLDRETTARLEEGVQTLREGFRRHVVELFGDSAEADIEVDRDEGRPSGLRIRLQPPGKQTRQLNLLSVGERTMGAMAFLFALMSDGSRQGLPIAVLDEVDAPLDEANIRRYCDFLSRLAARGTQFVLITHQKATFEVADVLWGVTTEGGVSRVFSIARPEALPVA